MWWPAAQQTCGWEATNLNAHCRGIPPFAKERRMGHPKVCCTCAKRYEAAFLNRSPSWWEMQAGLPVKVSALPTSGAKKPAPDMGHPKPLLIERASFSAYFTRNAFTAMSLGDRPAGKRVSSVGGLVVVRTTAISPDCPFTTSSRRPDAENANASDLRPPARS